MNRSSVCCSADEVKGIMRDITLQPQAISQSPAGLRKEPPLCLFGTALHIWLGPLLKVQKNHQSHVATRGKMPVPVQ